MTTIDDVKFEVKCEGGYWNAYAILPSGTVIAETQGQTPVTAMISCEPAARIALKRSKLSVVR